MIQFWNYFYYKKIRSLQKFWQKLIFRFVNTLFVFLKANWPSNTFTNLMWFFSFSIVPSWYRNQSQIVCTTHLSVRLTNARRQIVLFCGLNNSILQQCHSPYPDTKLSLNYVSCIHFVCPIITRLVFVHTLALRTLENSIRYHHRYLCFVLDSTHHLIGTFRWRQPRYLLANYTNRFRCTARSIWDLHLSAIHHRFYVLCISSHRMATAAIIHIIYDVECDDWPEYVEQMDGHQNNGECGTHFVLERK